MMFEVISETEISSGQFTHFLHFQYLLVSLENVVSVLLSSVGKESACNTGDPGSIPGLGRSLGEGNGNPL